MEQFTVRSVKRISTLLTIVCVLVDAGYLQRANERIARAINDNACELPPQPPNGRWKLHPLQCTDQEECDVESGTTELPLGSRLVYSCNAGYKIIGTADVNCTLGGNWLTIPDCTEVRCEGLSTVSVAATCRYEEKWVDCQNPVLPGTKAGMQCRRSYRSESNRSSNQRHNVTCNPNGVWEPEPLRCVLACGLLPSDLTPPNSDSVQPNTAVLPWHASIYRDDPGYSKKFICGATIIQDNLLITAAHCLYNITSKGHVDPSRLHVMTGNIHRDYYSSLHNDIVKRAEVKNIYIKCNHQLRKGNYGSNVAILELVEPFVLSASLLPACVDVSFSDRLVPNAIGKMASFGRNSTILQSLKLPYIPYNQCKSASENFDIGQYITTDTFCAGYTNGSSGCASDSGGGLVFESNSRWFLRGIVSVPLGATIEKGEFICDPYIYSLFIRLSSHIEWVQDVITSLDLNWPYMSCSDRF